MTQIDRVLQRARAAVEISLRLNVDRFCAHRLVKRRHCLGEYRLRNARRSYLVEWGLIPDDVWQGKLTKYSWLWTGKTRIKKATGEQCVNSV